MVIRLVVFLYSSIFYHYNRENVNQKSILFNKIAIKHLKKAAIGDKMEEKV